MREKEYKAVFFDLDDTLYSRAVPFKEACEDFFCKEENGRKMDHLPVDPYIAHERFRSRGDEVFLPSRRGEITMEEMYIYRFSKAMADLGITVTDEEALYFQKRYKYRQNHIHLDEQVRKILELVKEKQLLMGVITNGPQDHQTDKYYTLGLDAFMDVSNLFVSGAYGSNKPETKMFTEAERQTGLKNTDFLYVGDSFESDVCGALAAGWDVLWLDLKGENERAEKGLAEEKNAIPGAGDHGAKLFVARDLQGVLCELQKLLQIS